MLPSSGQRRSLEERASRFAAAGPPNLLGYLTGRGLGEAARERFRLGYVEPADDVPKRYWHRMAIPYDTPGGVVQIRYRCLIDHHGKGQDDGGCPKFLGDEGLGTTLYNAQATLRGGPVLFLCEGEPDVWAVETLAGHPAVGIPGANNWGKHPYWARCFVNFPRLILVADGDAAGDTLATAVARDLPETTCVRMPDGEDANSLLARDPAAFARLAGLAG